jgi:hypothetical protein
MVAPDQLELFGQAWPAPPLFLAEADEDGVRGHDVYPSMSGCPWTLSLSLPVVLCRLSKKRDSDDLVAMLLNVTLTHELGSFLNASMAGVSMTGHPR